MRILQFTQFPSYQSRKLANFTLKIFNPSNKDSSRDFLHKDTIGIMGGTILY